MSSTARIVQYVKRISGDHFEPYKGALWDYLDFLHPLLGSLRDLSFLPSAPIYLLIDYADYLNEAQTICTEFVDLDPYTGRC